MRDNPVAERFRIDFQYSVYNKTLAYVKNFTKFTTTDSASAVREYVKQHDFFCFVLILVRTLRREPALTQFETAQIANLCPADAEEAKSVIPRYAYDIPATIILTFTPYISSLVKIDDDRLQVLLDEIQTMRRFQS